MTWTDAAAWSSLADEFDLVDVALAAASLADAAGGPEREDVEVAEAALRASAAPPRRHRRRHCQRGGQGRRSAPSRSRTGTRWSKLPEEAADDIVRALSAASIRGRRFPVRRDRR